MKKHILLISIAIFAFNLVTVSKASAQILAFFTPPKSTIVLSVSQSLSCSSESGNCISHSYYICPGVTITLLKWTTSDTIYLSAGSKLIGSANLGLLSVPNGATYDAQGTNTMVPTNLIYEANASILNYTGVLITSTTFTIYTDLDNLGTNPCTVATGINELNTQQISADVYPNPSSGSFVLSINNDSRESDVIIFNEIGQKVFQKVINNNMYTTINTSSFKNGIYSIQINIGGKILSKKVVVNN